MPNLLANLVFYGWPLIVMTIFLRLPLILALPWAILAGYLVAPHGMAWNLPLLPTYEKNLATAVTALAMCLALESGRGAATAQWRAAGWLPRAPAMRALVLMFLLQPIVTVLANLDPTTSGGRSLPALSVMDVGAAVYEAVTAILPFLLARRYLATPEAREATVRALVLAGLAYSLLVAFEIRFSPQLNRMLYGYMQFNWIQQLRDGDFRPVVFLQHGLWTALFMAMALVATAATWRSAQGQARTLWRTATLWMALVLALSSSLGALVLGLPAALLARFGSARAQLLFAGLAAALAVSYPLLRNIDVVPTQLLNQAATSIDVGRGLSLQFRFDNEDALLARANERPLTGWGGWGRGRIYDEETGAGLSTTDSRWIITFGTSGWIGYAAEFGLLTLPLLMMWRRGGASPAVLCVGLALAVNLIDMMLNGTLTPLTWVLAGVALGYVENPARVPAGSAAVDTTRQRMLRPAIGATPGARSDAAGPFVGR